MKTLISVLVAALVLVGVTYSQNPQGDNKFTPRTLSAGTSMATRTVAAALDDTTQAFRVAGYGAVYIHLITATNDSATALLSYQVSNDGSTWSAFTLFDSIYVSGTVGANKAFALPAGALGGEVVRVRVHGSDSALKSANPSATVTTVIRRKPY
jgi:hypothetical protein